MFHGDRKEVEKHTSRNEREILASETCGCLNCMATFTPGDVTEWSREEEPDHPDKQVDRTGICPHCGDALIVGDNSGYQITDTFLEAMRNR